MADGAEGPQVREGCPGQTFQVSLLLSHLLAAPTSTSDVLLQPYLSSWDELVRYDKAGARDSFTATIKNEVIYGLRRNLDSVR